MKRRAASDNAMLDLLRRSGATISATAAEKIHLAMASGNGTGIVKRGVFTEIEEQQEKKTRSSIRRFKSKTEERFAAHLDELVAGKIITRWRYEADRLQLADHGQPACTYTPDFVAWVSGGGRIYFEVKSKYHRDSDTETRRIFLWARQQFGDEHHEFHAYREFETRPGEFHEIWGSD